MQPRPDAGRPGLLAALLAGAGVTHFLTPGFYDAIVPRLLPGPARGWTLASGVAELACSVAVARPSTRRAGATLAALLFVAVFPANVQMALDWRRQSSLRAGIAIARLPLQLPLIWWAFRVRRAATQPVGPMGPAV